MKKYHARGFFKVLQDDYMNDNMDGENWSFFWKKYMQLMPSCEFKWEFFNVTKKALEAAARDDHDEFKRILDDNKNRLSKMLDEEIIPGKMLPSTR